MTAMARPIERLHPQRVTSEIDLVGGSIDDGKGELAAQAMHRAFSPLDEGLQDHFGVAIGPQYVTEGSEL